MNNGSEKKDNKIYENVFLLLYLQFLKTMPKKSASEDNIVVISCEADETVCKTAIAAHDTISYGRIYFDGNSEAGDGYQCVSFVQKYEYG